MTTTRKALTWLALLLLCAVAIAPLLRTGKTPCTHDGGLHYFRVAAMKHAWQQGLLFTRWLPDLAFGYGFPFFNYRAPTSYYLPLGLHLIGLPLPLALNLVYVLSLAGSAAGAYLLARDLFGPQAGFVAAAAYAYAPYQLLDALVRGNAPESMALALMPFILWAFRRLALEGQRRWFLASTGLLATLYLTHNISSLLFTPLLMAYLVVLWWVYRPRGHWRSVILALTLALGMTAFFWLPALAEKKDVQLHLTQSNRNNDFRYNFLSLAEVFAPPKPFDTSLMNPPPRIRLGLVQIVLALSGLVTTGLQICNSAGEQVGKSASRQVCKWASPRERWVMSGFFALTAGLMLFMSTHVSLWVWEHVPLLPFVQFPWRFVGRAALPLALLAGAFGHYVSRFTRFTFVSRIAYCVIIAALVLAAFPATYPPTGYCPAKLYPTIADVHRFERESGMIGVDPVGAYFPRWVQKRPKRSPLEEQYASEDPVARFDSTALPEGATMLEAAYGPNRARVVVESPRAFQARYLSFYFPGWKAHVDGERVPITPSDPEGLITFDVPAGRHELTVRFGETPLRLGVDSVSLLALLALIILTVRKPKSARSKPSENLKPETNAKIVVIFLIAAILPAFKFLVVDRIPTPFRRPRLRADGTLPGVEHPLDQLFADGLTLIGYDQNAERLPADALLCVDLYWTVRRQPTRRYQTVIHLVGPDGLRWSRPDTFRPRRYQDPPPTTTWTPGRYALDSHEIEPLPGAPPGTYDLVLTVFDRKTLKPLSALDEQGQPTAPELTLGQVTLDRPDAPPKVDALDIRHQLNAPFGPLTLLGAEVDRDQASPGDPVFVTTFWRAEEAEEQNLIVRLDLLAPDGSTAAEYEFSPVASWHPTSAWQPGDLWRGQHQLHLPANLDTATYTWRFSILHPSSSILHPTTMAVTAPDRTFTRPPVETAIDTRLGDLATLVGANLQPETANLTPGTTLTATLVWRAQAEVNTSYRVFVHLISQEGKLIAQSDGIPAGWTRPTTSWLPGEYITDTHTLDVPTDAPAGEYTLQAGLYNPGGERLKTPDELDAIPLTAFEVPSP